MLERIIYTGRPFRDEFIEEIHTITPSYVLKAELQPEDLPSVEISLGWNSNYQERLLVSSNLKWVQSVSAGVDQLSLEAFSKKHILLSNGSGIHSKSIAEHVLRIVLGYSHGLFQVQRAQNEMKWLGSSTHYQPVQGKKILIIGTGHIGKVIVKKVKASDIIYYGVNTSGHPTERMEKTFSLERLQEILPEVDFVVNILPLAEETTGFFDQHIFGHFDSKAVFINVDRGASAKTQDLIQALNKQQLSFAVLGVFEEEPLPQNYPLWKMNNVLITSHIAGLAPDFRKKLMSIFLTNLKSHFATHSLQTNRVKLSVGY